MDTRLKFVPISEAEEGMVLGAPVVLPEHGVSNFNLPAGHTLTDSNLHQMAIRKAEFVCIEIPDERTPEEREAEWGINEMRLQQIFSTANLEDPATGRLYQAVLAFRRS